MKAKDTLRRLHYKLTLQRESDSAITVYGSYYRTAVARIPAKPTLLQLILGIISAEIFAEMFHLCSTSLFFALNCFQLKYMCEHLNGKNVESLLRRNKIAEYTL